MPTNTPEIRIEELPKRKTASASLRDGVIHIRMPRHWPLAYKQEVTRSLVRRVMAKANRDEALIERGHGEAALITLSTPAELTDYVTRINRETFNVPLAKVRIGNAKHSRLAQMNLKTRVMTVSRHCLEHVPEPALRYLIVHELAHLLEAGHNRRFWGLVQQFVPDYRHQSNVMKAFHRRAILALDPPEQTAPPATPPPAPPKPAFNPLRAFQLKFFGPHAPED